jgi:ring-1,2-phenylacetyl-CoA epoxidase subunit PaaE
MLGNRSMSRETHLRTRPTDWSTIALLAAMHGLLIGNFVLYRLHPLPFALHFVVSVAAIHLAFTIWHEAAHRNVSGRRWVNDVVGVLGMFPYLTPYFMQRWIHLEHHRQLNLEGDPNRIYTDGPFYAIALRYPRALGYARTLLASRDPRSPAQKRSDGLVMAATAALFAFAAWQGALVDVILLWLLPLVVAKVVMDWYINYLPHVGLPPGRFAGTRVIDVVWFTPLVLLHNYHAVHHLWPHVPWHRYGRVFREKRGYLDSHGVPIEHRVFARREPLHGAASGTLAR